MKFPWKLRREGDTTTASVTYVNDYSSVTDARTLKAIIDEFAHMYVKANYASLVKKIDKEAIAKEVALGVSTEVLKAMFKKEK